MGSAERSIAVTGLIAIAETPRESCAEKLANTGLAPGISRIDLALEGIFQLSMPDKFFRLTFFRFVVTSTTTELSSV